MMETIVEQSILVAEKLRGILGISWDCGTGKFVKTGKFKDREISGDSFIQVLKALTESQFEELRTVYGSEFPGTRESFPRFVLESYLERFPIPFQVSSGDDIHRVYAGFRPGSCMRYSHCRPMREFYAQNPERIKAIYWDCGIHPLVISKGSFLLWFAKSGNSYRDRFYSESYLPYLGELFPIQADSFIAREFPGTGSVASVWQSSERVKLTGFNFHGDLFPWMDSLKYGELSNGSVSLATYNFGDSVCLQDCDGTDIESGDSGACEFCCGCRNRFPLDELSSPEYGDSLYCSDCYGEYYSYSEYDGSEYESDSVVSATLLDSRGRNRETTISTDTLRSDFHEYSGNYWDGDIEYIHESLAIETTENTFVSSEDCQHGELGSTIDEFPVNGVDSDYIVPWGSDYAHAESEVYYWNSGNRRIPTARPVPRGFVPRSDSHSGEFIRKFGEFLVIVFDSSGDSSSPFSVGIRSPFHANKPISVPRQFRFRTESEAKNCLRILSDTISGDSAQWERIKRWNGEPSDGVNSGFSQGYLSQCISIVNTEITRNPE